MAKRRTKDVDTQYVDPRFIPARSDPPSLASLAMAVPGIISSVDKSIIKRHQAKPDWSLYKIDIVEGNPFIVREMCDRCGKKWVPPSWRKTRAVKVLEPSDLGTVYVQTGLCKDCINAAVYSDYYLDGEPLTFVETRKLFMEYAVDYERAWRMVIAAAPKIIATEDDWQKACTFFNGCAFCGGKIEVRAMYFPAMLNGKHTPWNVIPLCGTCRNLHYMGRNNTRKTPTRYKVFSTEQQFNKQKTTRVYLLQQMREHSIYMDPLIPFMTRFRETLILEGSASNEWLDERARHEENERREAARVQELCERPDDTQ